MQFCDRAWAALNWRLMVWLVVQCLDYNTLIRDTSFWWMVFEQRSKIHTVFSSYDRSGWSSNSSYEIWYNWSDIYLLTKEIWNTGCTVDKLGERASLSIIPPTRSSTPNEPTYLGLNLPHFPNITLPLVRENFMRTWSPRMKLNSRHLWSTYECYLFWVALNHWRMVSITLCESYNIFVPNANGCPPSSQHVGDLNGLPYNTSNGFILILSW